MRALRSARITAQVFSRFPLLTRLSVRRASQRSPAAPRGARIAATVLALAASAPATTLPASATPPPALDAPAPMLQTAAIPSLPKGVPVDALSALVPAIVGSVATAQTAEQPQHTILDQAHSLLAQMGLPPQIKATLERIVTFLDGSAGGGPGIPQDGPAIAQFLYPSIGKGCISPTEDSVGTALAVPGPAQLPPPGPKPGQSGFVFTALGTGPDLEAPERPLTVQWLNLDTHKSGVQPLTNAATINPAGPATVSTIADTGPGRIVAVIDGDLTSKSAAGQPHTCQFVPTLGFFTIA